MDTLKARKAWNGAFEFLHRGHRCQLRLVNSATLSVMIGESTRQWGSLQNPECWEGCRGGRWVTRDGMLSCDPVSLSLIPETPWQQHGFTKVVLWPPYACCGVMVIGVPWEVGNQTTAHSAGAMWGTLHRRECMHGAVELVKSPYLGKLECYVRIYCSCFARRNVVDLSFNIYITTQDWLLALGTPQRPTEHRWRGWKS